MKVSIFSVSILAAIAAFALLVFSISVPGSPARHEGRNSALSANFSGMHIEELEHRARQLTARLGESERRLAQWEESYHKDEVPQYYLKRLKRLGYPVRSHQGVPQAPGSARGSGRVRGAGQKQAGREAGGLSPVRPVSVRRAGTAKRDKGRKDGSEAQKAGSTVREGPRYVGGLLGLYYQGKRFDSLKLVMTDYEVDFDFADRSPDRIIVEDNFSIRWQGYVKIDREANYTFRTLSDDGVRLWIGGRPVINNWGDHAATFNTGAIHLKEGYHSLRLDFYENGGVAAIKLYWSSDRFPMEIVPPANLYHDPAREEKARKELP